ncbi:MAG TPA: SMP-30/gluconolactonase/LRE family protein [Geminicoccaceae bacterium]|nr:SMP-30/gluconolactonase/LRE family protein [Geminicoccaceae bacterium]
MRVEIALDARNGVGEGPFWDELEQALWWVDIVGKTVLRWIPRTGAQQRWALPDFPSAVVLRRGGGALVAMRDGLYFLDPAIGRLELFCRPEADRPDNRSNEAKCGPTGDFWLGTMQNNLHADGSAREMTGSTGALYRVCPDGSFTREVDGVGLANTLAWTDGGRTMLFADTLTGVISAFAVRDDGRLGARRVFSDQKLPGYCDGSAIDGQGCLWNARFAGGCLIRFTPDGRVDRSLELPVANPTSCCFGGSDLKTLYVTSARFGLSQEQLDRNPAEGAVVAIAVDEPGTQSVRFAG